MMDIRQFNTLILRPTLRALDLHSFAAEKLMLGTAVHESDGLRYIKQRRGPALSFFQIEPATARDVLERWLCLPRHDEIRALFRFHFETHHDIEERLLYDLRFACAVARLVYYRVPEPLPPPTLAALATYWKSHYNTSAGKGRVEDWIANYRRHVEPVFN